MVASGGGSGGSGRLTHDRDDLGTSLLHLRKEGAIEPGVVVDNLTSGASTNSSVESIRVLSGGMVTPDDDVVDVLNGGTGLVGDLAGSSALIKSGESGEVRLGDRGGVVGADECVGVGRVADNGDLHGLLGDGIDGSTLSLENLGVGLKEIGSFHSGASGSGSDENSDVSILEANHGVGGGDDLLDTGVGTVLKLHDETLEDLLGLGELDQLQDDLLVGTESSALSNKVAKEGADLTGGTSDGDADGGLLKRGRGAREVSSEGLESVDELVLFDHCLEC